MHHPTRTLLALALLLSIASAGCDLFAAERNHDPITASGTVVLAGTREPLTGISVTIIDIVPPGISSPLATVKTDTAGRFALSYDPPKPVGAVTRGGYALEINTNPYDDRYTTGGENNVRPGTTLDLGAVELSLNPTP